MKPSACLKKACKLFAGLVAGSLLILGLTYLLLLASFPKVKEGDSLESVLRANGRPDQTLSISDLQKSDTVDAYKFARRTTRGYSERLAEFPEFNGRAWIYHHSLSYCTVIYLDQDNRVSAIFVGST